MPELWDVYDSRRRLAGRLHTRGVPMREGDYHLGVRAVLLDGEGRVLLTRRHPDKPFGGYWECTGGAVEAGETSLTGVIREVWEEIGVALDPRTAVPHHSVVRLDSFLDVWVFFAAPPAESLRLQETEVTDAKWATRQEFEAMCAAGELAPPAIEDIRRVLDDLT